MVGPAPLAVGVPSLLEVAFAVLVVVSSLLKWQSLSGEFSPSALVGEYRDGKQSVEEAKK